MSISLQYGRLVPTPIGTSRDGFHMGRGWNPESLPLGAGEGTALSRSCSCLRYGLLGHPVAGSLSPRLYAAAFKAHDMNAAYELWDVDESGLREKLDQLRDGRLAGANVTIPHKPAAAGLARELTPPAKACDSVNTLAMKSGILTGHSTDGEGALRALKEAGVRLDGARICILGTGGAARAILGALITDGTIAQFHILGRREETLARFMSLFPGNGSIAGTGTLSASPETSRILDRADLIINATPVGMHPRADRIPVEWDGFHRGQTVFDLIYNPRRTRLLERARAGGAQVLGGLPMLIHQAALAFEWWTGLQAPVSLMEKAVEG